MCPSVSEARQRPPAELRQQPRITPHTPLISPPRPKLIPIETLLCDCLDLRRFLASRTNISDYPTSTNYWRLFKIMSAVGHRIKRINLTGLIVLELDAETTNQDVETLSLLPEAHWIRRLSIRWARAINDGVVPFLKRERFGNLNELDLWGCRLDPVMLETLDLPLTWGCIKYLIQSRSGWTYKRPPKY